jgi:hypothetical protein
VLHTKAGLTLATPNQAMENVSRGAGTVRGFRQKFTLEDAIEFQAFAPLEARARRVTNVMPLGCSLLLLFTL